MDWITTLFNVLGCYMSLLYQIASTSVKLQLTNLLIYGSQKQQANWYHTNVSIPHIKVGHDSEPEYIANFICFRGLLSYPKEVWYIIMQTLSRFTFIIHYFYSIQHGEKMRDSPHQWEESHGQSQNIWAFVWWHANYIHVHGHSLMVLHNIVRRPLICLGKTVSGPLALVSSSSISPQFPLLDKDILKQCPFSNMCLVF